MNNVTCPSYVYRISMEHPYTIIIIANHSFDYSESEIDGPDPEFSYKQKIYRKHPHSERKIENKPQRHNATISSAIFSQIIQNIRWYN